MKTRPQRRETRHWSAAFAVLALLLQCLLAGYMQSGAAMAATMSNCTPAMMAMQGGMPAMPGGCPCCQDCMCCTPAALATPPLPPNVAPRATAFVVVRPPVVASAPAAVVLGVPRARGPPLPA